jgi:hypothetical protein
MRKSPCPVLSLVPDTDVGHCRVIQFDWENLTIQMYDDEALRLARTIYDVLEVPTSDWEME